jgi:hypothetical protein
LLFFDAGDHDPLDEVALGDNEQDHRQGQCHQCAGLDQLGLLAIEPNKILERHRNRVQLCVGLEIDQRTKEVIPREHNMEDRDSQDHRLGLGQYDRPQDTQRANTGVRARHLTV